MDRRARIIVTGRVQKAGFREYVDERAFELGLRGYVKNLDDGTVEIVCEGPAEKLAQMAEKVRIKIYPIRVDRLDTELSEPTGEFREFDIVPDPRLYGQIPQGFLVSSYLRYHAFYLHVNKLTGWRYGSFSR